MNDDTDTAGEPAAPANPEIIKRRWAIVRKASGGVAVLAIAGALSLGDQASQDDPGQDVAGGDSHISAEA
jgi:hypothetical protein